MTELPDRPFTPKTAREAGLSRPELERLLRTGRIRRILRGVYVDAALADSTELRARAAGLVVSADAVVCDRTAAWVHGTAVPRAGGRTEVPPVEVVRDRRRRRLVPRDVQSIADVAVTTPLRTAVDLGRLLAPERAIAALDSLLRTGAFTHVQLLAALPATTGLPHAAQLRDLAAFADSRATCAAESVLRLQWCAARLPTPTLRLRLSCPDGWVHLALAAVDQRFGVVLAGQIGASQLAHLEGRGWRVPTISEERALHADATLVQEHLIREYHQHLLAQVS